MIHRRPKTHKRHSRYAYVLYAGRIDLCERRMPNPAFPQRGAGASPIPVIMAAPVTIRALIAVGFGLALVAASHAADAPPAYAPLRWSEDYSYLKDPARRTDGFDPIKYIPLNAAGDWYLSLGGQARYRYELFNNNNFGAGPQDDDGYHLGRFLAHADLHLGENLRGFFQVKSALEDGRVGGPRPSDADEFDVQQAFVDLKLPLPPGRTESAVTLRFGRQELLYGAQRLIGPL